MAHKAHIGQQIDHFSAFENAIVHFLKMLSFTWLSWSLKTAQIKPWMLHKFKADIRYSEFNLKKCNFLFILNLS